MKRETQRSLRELRLAAGLSIRALSDRTGINRGRLSIIERGVVPSGDELRRILAVLQP
jgi:transcriptional regulator with XRE-family HTH domain